jgi:hypothetical protein
MLKKLRTVLGFLIFPISYLGLKAEVPTDEEGFTRYVLKKFEEKIPGHDFMYVEPSHIRDNKTSRDTVGDEYLGGLFKEVTGDPIHGEESIDRYVAKTAKLVGELKRNDDTAQARGDFGPPFPNLGTADPNLLIWIPDTLTKFNINDFIILRCSSGKLPNEISIASGNFDESQLELLYPHHSDAIVGLALKHCYPFGNGEGFIQHASYSFTNPLGGLPFSKEEIVLFGEKDGKLVPAVSSDETVNDEFNLERDSRFLGKLDGKVFYWDRKDESEVFGRDSRNGTVYRWKIPGVYFVDGVLRGREKAYGFVVIRKAFPSGANVVVEASMGDAEVVTNVIRETAIRPLE